MDNKYEIVIKQLMHERNELRKYIIGICELLAINTGSSVLGANCVEFYAVLYSTAKYKIEELQKQFEQKEQECEELSSTNKRLGAELCGKLQNYMRAFDEIEKVLEGYCSNGISEIPQSQMEFTTSLLTICEAKLQKILIITQEVKEA